MTDVHQFGAFATAAIAAVPAIAGPAIGYLMAQVSADPISGGAGWVGTGLLGSVLAWLFFKHLPAKDKQIADQAESKDKQIADLIATRDILIREQNHAFRDAMQAMAMAHAAQDKERRDDYRASLQVVVNHCERETTMTAAHIRQDLNELSALVRQVIGDGPRGPRGMTS